MNDDDTPTEAALGSIFETKNDGSREQLPTAPPRVSVEQQKIVLAIFGALDLQMSKAARSGAVTVLDALCMLEEFREIASAIDPSFHPLLAPENTKAVPQRGGQA